MMGVERQIERVVSKQKLVEEIVGSSDDATILCIVQDGNIWSIMGNRAENITMAMGLVARAQAHLAARDNRNNPNLGGE